ncbi:MAG TPA: DNA translocase FtsK 4TM domain-containing protein [Acidimicrobiia bacterium]
MAVVLVILGILITLGLASNLAGPLGDALASGTSALLGQAQPLVPFACFGLAALLFWARPNHGDAVDAADDKPDEERAEPAPLRVGLGAALLFLTAIGAMHLAAGSPAIDGPLDKLRDAGGLAGALVAGPLQSATGVVGASVVLAGLATLGVLLALGIPMQRVFHALSTGACWSGHRLRELVRVTHVEDGDQGVQPAGADAAVDDEDAETEAAEATDEHAAAAGGEVEAAHASSAPRPKLYDHADDLGDGADLGADNGDEILADIPPLDIDVPPVDIDVPPLEVDAPPAAGAAAPAFLPAVIETPVKRTAKTKVRTTVESTGQVAMDLGPGSRANAWKLPAADLLKRGSSRRADRHLVEEGGSILETTLHEFGVDAALVGMTIGPTVTRYELELAPGVKVNRVTGLSHDIAYAMASADVRILAPIPGRSAIGVEVPNKQRQLVTLGDVLASKEAEEAKHPLEVGLGRDISGRSHMLNLATMPHLLIAGATGAGKSSCINSLVSSILMRSTPDQVRLILVDPKRVELGAYNDLPHLLTSVVTNPKKAANALDWAVREMDMRYELLSEIGVRDITGYNAAFDRGDLPTRDDPDPVTGKGYERLPFIVIVVDELNDLMMVAARDVEASICRIAQMARAVGIHLVIATQRPSVDVITGVIKANIPSRLAFSVSSLADSRVILDQSGAEKLIGQGDMLLVSASSNRAQRIQGSWVDEECVHKLVAHWKRQAKEPLYVEGVADDGSGGGSAGQGDLDDDDELLHEAMELIVRSGLGSTSMLQRKLRVGFSRAGRIMDLLERRGVVGPSEGSKARTVLLTVDELEEMQSRV